MGADVQTHTLPMALMVVLVLAGAAGLVLLYRRRRELQAAVEAQFEGFREKAMALMDQLDALKRRHRTLPSTDPDFTAPMSGATLTFYNAVEADLNLLWERWLEVMELWDRAQKLVRASSILQVRQAEEARKLLDLGHIDDLLRQSAACKERLDRLNRAHEDARESLAAVREDLTRSIDDGGRGRADFRPDGLSRLGTSLDQAEGMLVADPIGAGEVIGRTRRSLAELTRRPEPEPERPSVRRPQYVRRFGPRPGYQQGTPQPSGSLLDDLAAAADGFLATAARLRVANVLGLFVRFWLIVWGLGLVIGLLGHLLPLLILGVGFLIVFTGFWVIWQVVTFWFWFFMWGMRR
jgi:hypothetical protein